MISLTAMMYLLVFPAIIPLRRKYPDRQRPFRVPGGTIGMWLCVIGAEAIIVITTITLLWPGLIDAALGHSYSISDVWGVSRVYFESVTLGIVAFFVVVAVAFWALGRRNVAKGLVGEDDLLSAALEEVPGPATPSATRRRPRRSQPCRNRCEGPYGLSAAAHRPIGRAPRR